MLFEDTYKTIVQSEEILYKSKGSKFHAYAFLVKNESEIKEQLKSMLMQDQAWQKAKFAEMMKKMREKARIE